MQWTQIKGALARTYEGVQRKHTMQMAAGLSYYFVMSLFPLLIVFAAAVAYFLFLICLTRLWVLHLALCPMRAWAWSKPCCAK
jgi:uncharacterized BrkB/YihY/UPF0761 family membrane protein